MNRLAITLADIVREKVRDTTRGRTANIHESRLVFHGPPLDLLESVFELISNQGGIQIERDDGTLMHLPVLLVVPDGELEGTNPGIGATGKCDESHLLDARNTPLTASFVALMPPGQHSNMSVATTSEDFGMHSASNTGHSTFEEWWSDAFVQQLVTKILRDIGISEEVSDDAKLLIERSAAAIDEMDRDSDKRIAVWHLLSRIYSIPDQLGSLKAGTALALACGVPPTQDDRISAKAQLSVLDRIADEMANGFRTGIERISVGVEDPVRAALRSFLGHVQNNCEVPTAFERATQAFYLPDNGLEIVAPPIWWSTLTAECWCDLLEEEPDQATGDLLIECTNSILPPIRGIPALVKKEVDLSVSVGASDVASRPVLVDLTGGSHGKTAHQIEIQGSGTMSDCPNTSGQKSPITYKVSSIGRKSATVRVISLATWIPGIVVSCRLASKFSAPKKPRRSTNGPDWESSLSLPGSGRYELLIFTAAETRIIDVTNIPDDATESKDSEPEHLTAHQIREGEYQVEIEAEGKCQIEIVYAQKNNSNTESCRTYITCEEVREEGCKSEFERLIKLNRRHLEKFDSKTVIQIDRHSRSSSLQSWILSEENVEVSFIPIVIADDYGVKWAPPDWGKENGPILSQAKFLHDPRPEASLFQPPAGFIDARREIAKRIRETGDQIGLLESAPLGKWLARSAEFRELVEKYLDTYNSWLTADRNVACWVDAIAVCPREGDGRTLSRVPDAIILSPMHPLRLAWHCLAQKVLYTEVEERDSRPCPAASILDPDCVPDLLTMSLQTPGGPLGIEFVDFLSVDCNSDYWSVLWNGSNLGQLSSKSRLAPFDSAFGLEIGGISSGFSPAQVARSLEDVFDLLSAKPTISLVVSSAGGTTDACNEGLTAWCTKRFGSGQDEISRQSLGSRVLEVFDTRPIDSRPDQATIANLSEDTGNHVRWFEKQPSQTKPDLGIIAQLDSAQPASTNVDVRSPLSTGGLFRHRVRRQLHGRFISESRQGLLMPESGDVFADKVLNCLVALEDGRDNKIGLQFAPDVHAISNMLDDKKASFVAISSSAIDPACFLGGWVPGTYLWDYDLPSYSNRAGDTSGYYLLSQVREADRHALRRVLEPLPNGTNLSETEVEQILLEVARRGIPTIRGLSGDDTGATGDLGLFLAVRLLQDQFRLQNNVNSLLPVLAGSPDNASIALIIPVDPFRGYLADLAKSLTKDKKEASLSRPDLLVVGMHISQDRVAIHLTPIEVKCRQGSVLNATDAKDALSQAKSLSSLLQAIEGRAKKSQIWKLAFEHLLLSMVGFALRVYSQHEIVTQQSSRWAGYHERIAAAIFKNDTPISIDNNGRLVVIDNSAQSDARDHDGDGFDESVFISQADAGRIVAGDAQTLYDSIRAKIGNWGLLPNASNLNERTDIASVRQTAPDLVSVEPDTSGDADAPQPEALVNTEPTPAFDPSASSSENSEANGVGEPLSTTGVVLSVGRTIDGFEPRPLSLNISDTRLNQLNIGVVGDLGTGKTQLLKSLIFQIATARKENRGISPRFLIFDYKRDYSSDEFVDATGARVVRPKDLPLNLFDTSLMEESVSPPWLDRFRFFADILDKVYSGIGPVQRDKLKGAVRNAYASCEAQGRPPTLYDVHAEYRTALNGRSDSIMAIIDDLVDMRLFAPDLSKTMSFDQFFDGIVVISLDAMGQDDRSKNMLVAIMLNMFYENMLKTPKRGFIGRDPQLRVIDSYLLVDEADNIMRYEFDVLRKLLLQGREFGTGVILASQYLRHFKVGATDYREPLLTWFIHKVPNATPAELGALGFTSDLSELSERVKTLPNHQCLYKSFDVAGEVMRGLPFYELNQRGNSPQ